MINRRKSKQISIGNIKIGGDAPISVQSMCNTDTRDAASTLDQISELASAGCEIVRLAVLNKEHTIKVVEAAKAHEVPIRIGINAGSLEKEFSEMDIPLSEKMVLSALRHVEILEDLNFYNTKISLKSSDVMTTIEAYRSIASKVDYPLHLGVTEAHCLARE